MVCFKIQKAIFLDRDGTLNIDKEYVSEIQNFEFIPNVLEALLLFQKRDFKLFIVTNQSGISRGIFSKKKYLKLQNHIHQKLLQKGIYITETIYCPYLKEGIIKPYQQHQKCRKPSPLMIQTLAKKHHIYLRESYMVGDTWTDIESGWRSGVTPIGIQTGKKPLLMSLKQVQSYSNLLEFAKSL